MNDSDLEEAMTNRLRARIEADRFDSEKPREPKTVPSDSEPTVAQEGVERIEESAKPVTTNPFVNHAMVESLAPDNGESASHDPKAPAHEDSMANTPTLADHHDLLGEELTKRFSEIKGTYGKLAAELEIALGQLAKRGVPAGFSVQNALAGAHREFLKLRRDVVAKLVSHHDGPIEVQRLVGMSDLEELIARVTGRVIEIAPEPAAVSAEPKPIQGSVAPEPEFVDQPPAFETAPQATPPPQSRPIASESSNSLWSAEVLAPPPVTPRAVNLPPIESPVSPEATDDADAILADADETVERILRIRVKPGKILPEWEEALIAARALKRRVLTESESTLSPETVALARGVHPLAALLRLIEQTGQLGDTEWAELHAIVEDGLGKPIAMAAARHRFMLED